MGRQVDFYLITNQVTDARYKLAARLCNKIQRLNQRILVVTDDSRATDRVDQLLWTFSDTSFAAHDLCHTPALLSSIHIGQCTDITDEVLQNNYDVLLNLATDRPAFSQRFNRVAEIVENAETAKTAARRRFRTYRDEGFDLETHNIEL